MNWVTNMVYITGDKHGSYAGVRSFCATHNTTKDDVLIVLGDNGINFYRDTRDYWLKYKLSKLPITLFLIKGNHDARPEKIKAYHESEFWNGKVYIEPSFPNLIFAKDGEVYDINGNKALVIGGAYSVDKEYRLINGLEWFSDEQPTPEIKSNVERLVSSVKSFDFILTHTCPLSFISKYNIVDELFDDTDTSTEEWLDQIESCVFYRCWYCGHWHVDKDCESARFMYHDIESLE